MLVMNVVISVELIEMCVILKKSKSCGVDGFYRAMHFSAKRGIAIACRLSVRPSVCLSVCL